MPKVKVERTTAYPLKGPLIQKSRAEREAMLRVLRQALEMQSRVVFAYVYGSFLQDRPFHDVDVAVYLDSDEGSPSVFALDLADDLEAALQRAQEFVPVDVRVLNQAPPSFQYHVFRGALLFSRDERRRGQLAARAVAGYLDLRPLRRQALKEAMTSWT